MKIINRQYDFWLLIPIVLIITNLLPKGSHIFEIYYNQIYPILRYPGEFLSRMVDFELIYFFVAFYILIAFWLITFSLKYLWQSIAKLMIWTYAIFLMIWGYNYRVTNSVDQWIQSSNTLDIEYIKDELCLIIDSLSYPDSILSDDAIERQCSILVRNQSVKWSPIRSNYPVVRVKKWFPSGILLRWNTLGVYFPFTFESYVDGDIHALELPFTMMHEMYHGHGWSGEAHCNFLAYLSGISSNNTHIRYSTQLAYIKYLMRNLKNKISIDEYQEYVNNLPKRLHDDIDSIRLKHDLHPVWFPSFQKHFYDLYLKFNGIDEGVEHYDLFVSMLKNYQEQHFVE